MKTVTVHITDGAYERIKTVAMVSFMAQVSEAHLPTRAMIKIINAIEEGAPELTIRLKEDKEA